MSQTEAQARSVKIHTLHRVQGKPEESHLHINKEEKQMNLNAAEMTRYMVQPTCAKPSTVLSRHKTLIEHLCFSLTQAHKYSHSSYNAFVVGL